MEISNHIYVCKKEDVPQQDHWAIFEFSTIHVPAEGVWAPGHGYPAHDESTINYIAYLDQQTWIEEIQKREKSTSVYDKQYIAVKISKPVTTTMQVNVNVSF